MKNSIENFIVQTEKDENIRERARSLARKEFNPNKVYNQIIKKFYE